MFFTPSDSQLQRFTREFCPLSPLYGPTGNLQAPTGCKEHMNTIECERSSILRLYKDAASGASGIPAVM